MMNRRNFIKTGAVALGGMAAVETGGGGGWGRGAGPGDPAGQPLYNGIRLPATWPPRLDRLTLEPMAVPYLQAPPAVIPIDVGRQLFVDDFLIEQTTLRRSYHQATYHSATPVLRPDQPW